MSEHARITRRLRVHGIVQGVGFRPTVDRHAATSHISGTVCNKGPYVEIYAQGSPEQVDEFCRLLVEEPPRRAAIVRIEQVDVPASAATLYTNFSIIKSEHTAGEIYVSPDIAICDECARELYDPTNRRYLHPFINCTCCGPRLTILDSLPYDRERTSMGAFPMCPSCEHEYHDPASRRYDAQPVCCNDCGPEVFLMGREERGAAAITEARRALAEGSIVAVKGIGGFHLCCDATSSEAVGRLRERKHRPAKPFAVMMRDETVAERECVLDTTRRELLRGHQKPIVLCERRATSHICEAVAPGSPRVGAFLPYAPIQLLLFSYPDGLQDRMPDCFVMTSANVSGAPICHNDAEVVEQLQGICDLILTNNRAIRTRADDSVVDIFESKPYMVRRSRGYAPLPVALSQEFVHGKTEGLRASARSADGRGVELLPRSYVPASPADQEADEDEKPGIQVLAVGGELKNVFCISKGGLFYPSAYVGDLGDLRCVQALEEAMSRMETLLEVSPEVISCDLHPRYNSRVVAEKRAAQQKLPLVGVQHHWAHIASCMAENDHPGRVLGLSFDGTGYGTDGTIWGGEMLVCDWHGFWRAGSIRPFIQVGGDRAALEGWRVACSMVQGLTGDLSATLELASRLALCDERAARAQAMMRDRALNAVRSTSVGRLFDALSAILGICRSSSYEGEASTQLQYAAERFARQEGTRAAGLVSDLLDFEAVEQGGQGFLVLRTDELFARLLRARLEGADVDLLAYAFHQDLAAMAAQGASQLAAAEGLDTVALSGGCFQNTLLLSLTKGLLEEQGLVVLTHRLIPPNDGGIALGQAVVAAQTLRDLEDGVSPEAAASREGHQGYLTAQLMGPPDYERGFDQA